MYTLPFGNPPGCDLSSGCSESPILLYLSVPLNQVILTAFSFRYTEASTSTSPVVYTFSPLSFNSMIIAPPPTAPDATPRYHISVSLNCFIPSSFITTIRRGSTEYGEYVGDFEYVANKINFSQNTYLFQRDVRMGISENRGTLCIRGKELPIGDALGQIGSHRQVGPNRIHTISIEHSQPLKRQGHWYWKLVRRFLRWDCTVNPRLVRVLQAPFVSLSFVHSGCY